MNTTTHRIVLVLSLLLVTTGVWAAGATYQLEVDGLACPFCAYGIEKKLNALNGVEQVETDIKDGAVRVTVAEGASLDETTARNAVESAGFTLRGFSRLSEGNKRPSATEE